MKKYYIFDKNLNLKQSKVTFPKTFQRLNINLLAKYSNIGYYLLTPLLIGVFLGLYLDGRFSTHYLTVIGILIGGIGSIYNLIRLINQ